jgi:hypothetical protein
MDDSLELFSAFGNVALALVLALVALAAWAACRRLPRPPRRAIALGAPLAVGATLVVGAHLALAGLGEPQAVIVRIDPAAVTSHLRWTAPQRRRIALASLSPLHRARVKALFDGPRRITGPFPPTDDRGVDRVRAWLRDRGECALTARLDRLLGAFERAAETRCERPGAVREAAEAALALGDVARAWATVEGHREAIGDGFDGRLLALHPRPPEAALATLPATSSRERALWACVFARLEQRVRDDRDPARWTPLLASPLAACRILAATAPPRRDAEALRALHQLPAQALRAWPSTLTTARSLLALSGAVTPLPCPARHAAALDGAWLARYPDVAATLRGALAREPCPLTVTRQWFPVTQALAAFEADDPTSPGLPRHEDLTVAWQLVDLAWERARTTLDPRLTRRRRAALERSFRGALAPVVAWSVGRLDAAWADGSPWPRGFTWPSVLLALDAQPRRESGDLEAILRAFTIPHHAVSSMKRWDHEALRAPANHPTLDAWIDYWRTGEFAPPHAAPSWLRDDAMRALAAAVEESERALVIARLGEPSLRNAERLSVIAYRLAGDHRPLEPWLRRAWASLEPSTLPLAAWEDALHTLHTCALRLRLATLRSDLEAALLRVRRLRREGDGFVQAVLDGPRPEAVPDDDERE